MERKRVVKKVKRLIKVKGECYFTLGVPLSLIDFIYRAVHRDGHVIWVHDISTVAMGPRLLSSSASMTTPAAGR